MAAELLELGVMFGALAAVGAVAAGLRQSVIPFYILTGIFLGEFVAGRPTDEFVGTTYAIGVSEPVAAFVEIGAELGIVFLLFFLGLEFNLDRLLEHRDKIGAVGLIDLGVNFGGGLLVGYALFGALAPAIVVAGMVYISSSAIITKSLIDLGWIANPESSPMLGTLVFEDLFIAVYLAVLSAMLAGSGDPGSIAVSVGIGLGFILLLLGAVSVGEAVAAQIVATDSREFVVLRVTAITVLVAGIALQVNVSEAVAAFFVGMAFSPVPQVEALETLLEPLRDVFAAVFFFWIGLVTDPLLFAEVVVLVVVAAVLTTPTKLFSGFWSGKVYDLDDRRATRVALGMVTRGEFTLIVASVVAAGAGAGAIIDAGTAADLTAFAVGYVLLMSILGTMLMQHSGVFERRVTAWRAE